MRFKLLRGVHRQRGVKYQQGDVIESEEPLDEQDPTKYERVSSPEPRTKKPKRAATAPETPPEVTE